MLARWLPDDAFWSAFDPVASSPQSGWVRKRRGVRPGCPDNWVVYCGRLITIELKSPAGVLSRAQRATREALLRARCEWWECRSANAAMWALAESGVTFGEVEREGGAVERWERPELEPWEIPRRSPGERRPRHPEVLARDRAAKQRWRERKRALAAAQAAGAGPSSEAA